MQFLGHALTLRGSKWKAKLPYGKMEVWPGTGDFPTTAYFLVQDNIVLSRESRHPGGALKRLEKAYLAHLAGLRSNLGG